MSALPPNAAAAVAGQRVCFGPKAEVTDLFDQRAGACIGKSPGFSPLRMRSTYPAAPVPWRDLIISIGDGGLAQQACRG